MLKILSILILFQSQIGFSQNEYQYSCDTLTYYTIYNRNELLQFDELKNSNSNWHFRFWTNDYVLDLKEQGDNRLSGSISMLARENNNDIEPNQVFLQTIHLDSILAVQVKNIISNFQKQNIPTQDSIKGWGRGIHGSAYGFQFLEDNTCTHNTYWQPSSFQYLKEAVIVLSFIDSLENAINIKEIDSAFHANIPFLSYTIDGYAMYTKWSITKEELKANKKRNKKAKRNKAKRED